MEVKNIIAGLTILQPYYKKPFGYNCGAEHDVLYAYATEIPLSKDDFDKLVKLGWTQEHVPYAGEHRVFEEYDPSESWAAYT